MKKIEAIIRSSRFEIIKESLAKEGINFFTFYEVKGFGHQKGKELSYRGAIYDQGFIGRIKLEIILTEEYVEPALAAIANAAHTGENGDGLILVTPVLEIMNIRSGLRGEKSINV